MTHADPPGGANGEAEPSSPPCQAYPFELSADVPAGTQPEDPFTTSVEVPYDGYVTSLVLGWPAGADNAVGIQFRNSLGEKYVPRDDDDEYIAQDDFQHAYDVCIEVSEGDTLVAQYVNTDTNNSHFCNVIPTIQEKVPSNGI